VPARTLAAENIRMLHAHLVILSTGKDLAGTIVEPGMLRSAQRDRAPASTIGPRTVGAARQVSSARRRPVANTDRTQQMYPGGSPRDTEALCQSSN
jgi:hypothetical protein